MPKDLKTVVRKDYKPFEYDVEHVSIAFDIQSSHTLVETTSKFKRTDLTSRDLFLHGRDLKLVELAIDGRTLRNPESHNEYSEDDGDLVLFNVPDEFQLTIKTELQPDENRSNVGFYRSDRYYVTQCEAEDFRRITFFPDRPDVLTSFTTKIEAASSEFPVLLSNGNLVGEKELPDGRKQVEWHDPFKKPSYLFALVAGDLAILKDVFVTMSGREVTLSIYARQDEIDKCHYAMNCLKAAMKWDEVTYGREYDLDLFNIVVINRFNMGAMENKSLNVFVSSAVLASADVATDASFRRIETVVAHEYFHNWSGNRVTCRDWFQLSLKEGFTVFRDSHFSEDMNDPTAARMEAVMFLKRNQFPEDKSSVAHAILQDSYKEISNLYTLTTYHKGAEVVRMLRNLLGPEKFREGTDHYFDTFDGQAVTIGDFLESMTAVSNLDLTQFKTWYTQPGNATLTVLEKSEGTTRELTIEQTCVTATLQKDADPFVVPLILGVVDDDGKDLLGVEKSTFEFGIESEMTYSQASHQDSLLFQLATERASLTLTNVPENAEISFLRDFSAPVSLNYSKNDSECDTIARLAFLAINDVNGYVRIDSCHTLYMKAVVHLERYRSQVLDLIGQLIAQVLDEASQIRHRDILHYMLSIPDELYVLDCHPHSDLDSLIDNRNELMQEIATRYQEEWERIVSQNPIVQPYNLSTASATVRSVRHLALRYLSMSQGVSEPEQFASRLVANFRDADNLTDRLATFSLLIGLKGVSQTIKDTLTSEFHKAWNHEPLVLDEWFRMQALCSLPDGLARVRSLVQHPDFDETLPTRFRSVYQSFADGNIPNFHALDGSGYRFFADVVIAREKTNPQVASRLAQPLTKWQRFDSHRQSLLRGELERILENVESSDLIDLVSRALGD